MDTNLEPGHLHSTAASAASAAPACASDSLALSDSASALPGIAARQSKRAQTTRMFESNLLEYFSRIHPATPFLVWLPAVGYTLYRSIQIGTLSLPVTVGIYLLGVLLWTLAEYFLHRFVFHWVNETAIGRRIHFVLHGVHHDFPQDRDRLVMPIGASTPLAVVFFGLFWAVTGFAVALPLFAGFTCGYLLYDGSHFAIHHFHWKNAWFRRIKRHHMLHHHLQHGGRFGVSSPLWDHVFGTMPPERNRNLNAAE